MSKAPDKDILAKIDEVFVVDVVAGKIYGKFKKEIGTYGSKGNWPYSCPYIYVGVLVEREHPVYRDHGPCGIRTHAVANTKWHRANSYPSPTYFGNAGVR